MEKNKKREIQVKVFRFFVPKFFRDPLKRFVYRERAKLRYKKFITSAHLLEPRTQNLIITLTSFPARINTISDTLISLLNQSLKPENILLWLAVEQFPNKEKDLPKTILNLQRFGLEIKWCKDLKSYKKLIPALENYSDKIFVTADDDIFYPKNWLKNLHECYQKDKESIFAHRIHRITFDENQKVKPYQDWVKCLIAGEEREEDVLFFTTGGGVLFPPNCFYKDVLKEDLFKKLCPLADDIWFWMMIKLNNKKIKIVKNNVYRIKNNGGTQEDEPLWKLNREAGLNDEQLKNVLEYYKDKILFK